MVAHKYFDDRFQPAAPAAPPASPPSPRTKRFRRGWLVGVGALTVAGGGGSGAVAAALVAHAAPVAAATPATTTTVQGTSSSATAESVYAQVSPGVVTITSATGRGQAIGSGIVLDTKGDILTNAHVIAGATQMQVTLSSGQTVAATLVGSNSSADLAVIRISVPASSLHPLTLGSSDADQLRATFYAIGSPLCLCGSIADGIVSNPNPGG